MSFRCGDCDKSFRSSQALQQHEGSPAHLHECEECDRSFRSEQALQQHLENSPVHALQYECEECDRSFGSEQALQQHLGDSPVHALQYECEECDRSFGSEQALQQHLEHSSVHALQYECEECDRSFGSEQALQNHLEDLPVHAQCETRVTFMFPSLHQDVLNAVSDDFISAWFHEQDSDRDSNNEYSTHVMGKFKCNDSTCSTHGWGSKKVAILIKGYPRNGYNAVVFNQRCKACNGLGMLVMERNHMLNELHTDSRNGQAFQWNSNTTTQKKVYHTRETSVKVVRGVFVGRRMSGSYLDCCESKS